MKRLQSFTLRDFSLRENRLADYPSLLSQEHNKRYTVRSVALTHPKIPSESFAYLNIMFNKINRLQEVKNGKDEM
jgi:hypothetical protein